ncbi:hypothetical protein EG329_006531 [Mollisiaceae sp. DMI_Dod_QoI]|nr:hypothetical protein EG329_006531 [Helotiales sp. DMI_Dod_QoI]
MMATIQQNHRQVDARLSVILKNARSATAKTRRISQVPGKKSKMANPQTPVATEILDAKGDDIQMAEPNKNIRKRDVQDNLLNSLSMDCHEQLQKCIGPWLAADKANKLCFSTEINGGVAIQAISLRKFLDFSEDFKPYLEEVASFDSSSMLDILIAASRRIKGQSSTMAKPSGIVQGMHTVASANGNSIDGTTPSTSRSPRMSTHNRSRSSRARKLSSGEGIVSKLSPNLSDGRIVTLFRLSTRPVMGMREETAKKMSGDAEEVDEAGKKRNDIAIAKKCVINDVEEL